MIRDILAEISSGKLNEEEVDEVIAALLDSGNEETVDLADALGLSQAEWTASAQGAWWEEIALWRSEGWPITCVQCGKRIDVEHFGWLVVHINGEGKLKHIKCP